jgi:hypothetical protein
MRPRPVLIVGRIVEGTLDVSSAALQAAVQGWPDGPVTVTIRPTRKPRTLAQNAWYWGSCVDLVSEHTGYTPEEVHEIWKQMFIPKHVAIADANGVVVDDRVIGGSTTKFSTGDMAEFTERCRQWAADTLGVVIPDPVE